MTVAEIMTWALTHKIELIQIYLSLVGAASLIVKMTPTLKDDHVLKAIVRFMGRFLALNNSITPSQQKAANKKG